MPWRICYLAAVAVALPCCLVAAAGRKEAAEDRTATGPESASGRLDSLKWTSQHPLEPTAGDWEPIVLASAQRSG